MKGGGGFLHSLNHPGISPPEVMGVEGKQVVSAALDLLREVLGELPTQVP